MARGKTPSAAKGGTSPRGGGKRAAEGGGTPSVTASRGIGGDTSPGGGGKRRGRRGDEIQVVGFVLMPDGSAVPVDDLTPEQRAEWIEASCKRLSQRMSDWFTQHPEEYAKV